MKELRRLCTTKGSIFSVSVSPDGLEAACATSLCDVVFCRLRREGPPEPVEYRGGIMRYSTDGYLFGSAIDERLMLSEVKTGKLLRRVTWHKEAVLAMAFSPDGSRLASGGKGELIICDVETCMPARRFETAATISGIQYMPDGDRIVTSDKDGTVITWDCGTAEKLLEMKGHTASARSIAVSENGRKLLSGGADGLLILWDAENGSVLRTYACETAVWSVAFANDDKHALCGCHNSLILWDLASGVMLSRHNEEIKSPFFVGMLPTGEQAITGSMDCTFRLWALYD